MDPGLDGASWRGPPDFADGCQFNDDRLAELSAVAVRHSRFLVLSIFHLESQRPSLIEFPRRRSTSWAPINPFKAKSRTPQTRRMNLLALKRPEVMKRWTTQAP